MRYFVLIEAPLRHYGNDIFERIAHILVLAVGDEGYVVRHLGV